MADANRDGGPADAGEFASHDSRHRDDCVICLSAVSERAIACPCNHCCFDFICLASWLGEQAKCPVCKADVVAIEYDWRAPDDYKTYRVTNAAVTAASKQPAYAARGRQRARDRVEQPSLVDIALIRRRNVYRYKLYSLHVGSNRHSGFRAVTPALIAGSAPLQLRAKKWIRRELLVFEDIRRTGPSSPSRTWAAGRMNNAEHLLGHMIELLGVVDARSDAMQDLLCPHIGPENALLFLHELHSWLRSPFERLEDWDAFVQYPTRRK